MLMFNIVVSVIENEYVGKLKYAIELLQYWHSIFENVLYNILLEVNGDELSLKLLMK